MDAGYEIIDIGVNLAHRSFQRDRSEVIERALAAGVRTMIVTGTSLKASEESPPFVQDYLILHEISHLKEMNHSDRFWREVERVCPDYRIAERWLKQHSGLLR